MGKRKLSRRQAWRIEKIQQEREARAVKRDTNIDQLDNGQADAYNNISSQLGPEQAGIVIAHFGTQVEVEATNSPNKSQRIRRRCHFRTHLGSLVTGDRVVFRDGNPTGVIVAVKARETALSRPDPYGELKTIAANIDRILIVIAPLPKPHTQLVDRYIVAAETLGIKAALVINKMDLIDDSNRATINNFIELYRRLGYEVITASTYQQSADDCTRNNNQGLQELQAFLANHTSVFVGQSGVGKSSLINLLIPDLNLQVGEISAANQKGTHTTTTAQLFHFPKGGELIDSPGIREFGLWHMEGDDILRGFVELRPFIGHCKFRDCQHKQEPQCAIRRAFEEGQISRYRMESYIALRDSTERE